MQLARKSLYIIYLLAVSNLHTSMQYRCPPYTLFNMHVRSIKFLSQGSTHSLIIYECEIQIMLSIRLNDVIINRLYSFRDRFAARELRVDHELL